ncbi:MAG TPA: phage tail sheath subtilisin-like domain-containing protein [Oligoflexus sp.]|uniref:phage tail sheath subtilisin-like domain-containing protein n=1 Tax=Oligoflexus sp. TaxID=1971216 RepID=UPI002D286538|nr:phage tail sheath subtilisin-like domain-containing protein [Oligoflexus sp.]HYX35321.1 phage tail sheath subtilisin-like domain-containing protein [Oligoflexus sp.]
MADILADPIVSSLKSVARRLNAVVVADAPSGKEKEYRVANGSERLYLVSPAAKEFLKDALLDVPASAHAAGIMATINFWESPSNKEISGIVGTSRPISFALDDPDSEGQLLNSIQVATIVRLNGFRLWGVRGTGDQTDLKTNQLQKVRISDAIKEALISSHAYAVARNLTRTYFETVTASVNAYLADLQVLGAIAGGICYAKAEANTPENLFDGKATFVYSYTPSPVSETLTFEEQITDKFLENIVN